MNKFTMVYRVLTAVSVTYTTYKLLDEKTNELLHDGGVLSACTIGAGQMGISIAAGLLAATTITNTRW